MLGDYKAKKIDGNYARSLAELNANMHFEELVHVDPKDVGSIVGMDVTKDGKTIDRFRFDPTTAVTAAEAHRLVTEDRNGLAKTHGSHYADNSLLETCPPELGYVENGLFHATPEATQRMYRLSRQPMPHTRER